MKAWQNTGLALVLIGLGGCTTSGIEATGKPFGNPEFAKHLAIHNDALAENIIIQQMHTRLTGGLLEVSLVLANLADSDQSIQYRFSWYDADSFEIEQDSRAWTPVILHGQSHINMQAVAPNTTVTTYKVNVKELK